MVRVRSGDTMVRQECLSIVRIAMCEYFHIGNGRVRVCVRACARSGQVRLGGVRRVRTVSSQVVVIQSERLDLGLIANTRYIDA